MSIPQRNVRFNAQNVGPTIRFRLPAHPNPMPIPYDEQMEESRRARVVRQRAAFRLRIESRDYFLRDDEDHFRALGVRYFSTTPKARERALVTRLPAFRPFEAPQQRQDQEEGELFTPARLARQFFACARAAWPEPRAYNILRWAQFSQQKFHRQLADLERLVVAVEAMDMTMWQNDAEYRRATEEWEGEGLWVDQRVWDWVWSLPETAQQWRLGLDTSTIITKLFLEGEEEE